MNGKKHRRHKTRSIRSLPHAAGSARRMIAAHPRRLSLAALLSFFLCWAVLTKSLPYVLAAAEPDLALTLNSNNPAALVSKAAQINEKLLSMMAAGAGQPEAGQAEEHEDGAPGTAAAEQDREDAATIDSLPRADEAASGEAGPQGLGEELRRQIRQLAAKAIANDPLNAAAFRLMAEATADPEHVRGLMREAVRRSRRETSAVFWLLNESYFRKDFPVAIEYADIMLQTRPAMSNAGFNYLLNIARDADGRRLVANRLAENPKWRQDFLWSLWPLLQRDQVGLELIAELKNTKSPAATGELSDYINKLAMNGAADTAYSLWLQTLPRERLENFSYLTNPGFEAEPAGSATVFDWEIGGGGNATAEFVPSGRPGRQRLLHLSFGDGRIEFPGIRQVLVLPPGHYRLSGQLRGSIIGKRGLRWQLRCNSQTWTVLGETEMLLGESEEWRMFTLEADVAQSAECIGQVLVLYHDARSASEEYLRGEAWFGGLHLERTAGEKSAAR
ncbi:MAG: hypothetical protein ACLPX9_00795 [Rhodomicrobium sp.]